VLYLARDAFERLMGPAEKVLAERIREYEAANAEAAGKPAAAATFEASSQQVWLRFAVSTCPSLSLSGRVFVSRDALPAFVHICSHDDPCAVCMHG